MVVEAVQTLDVQADPVRGWGGGGDEEEGMGAGAEKGDQPRLLGKGLEDVWNHLAGELPNLLALDGQESVCFHNNRSVKGMKPNIP